MRADWFDPHRSRRFDAALRLEPDRKTLRAECSDGRSIRVPAGEVRVSPRLGSAAQSLLFPNGTTLLIRDTDALEQILTACGGHLGSRIQHKAEHSYRLLLPIACAAVVLAGVLVLKGLPVLAEYIAWKVPLSILDKPAKELLAELEGNILQPSRLDESRENEIRTMFAELAAELPWERDYHLLLRRIQIPGYERGLPNAFAFPNGTVLVTDSLVELAESKSELIGVLAHEMEHMRQRHSIQSIVSSFILAAVAGLVTGNLIDFVTLPVFLAKFSYTRQHEVEADCLAYDYMKRKGLDISAIGNLLERMERVISADSKRSGGGSENAEPDRAEQPDYIGQWALEIMSTHPLTHARKDPAKLCADYTFKSRAVTE